MVLKVYSDPVVFGTKYAVYGRDGEISGRVFVLDEAAQERLRDVGQSVG